ncbi:Na+:solute symporter [Candidatus Sulfidibacterium hydrothermale]|uniref:sodium:solute symporter family protein n=1 Tax=Candidatus Sulfidibacterium hydrothermale TaxID=2875962 RepID=UPI001F0B3E09|nr:sodium:solute symporter family protein [Candidatus Sulfidibacterium hydrothermale]UBM62672.1 Na+:solute symporter [Candidatus Sulfidibacterium hydrothermale]
MIDLILVAAFVIYSVSAGFFAKSKASKNLTEYFLAGRSIKGWKSGVSIAATQYAADTPLLVTGLVATGGIFMLWRLWIYGISFLFIGFVLSKSWWRSRILTDAELTEVRYSGKVALWLRGVKALFYGIIINSIVLAMVLLAATRISEVFLVWDQWLSPSIYNTLLHWVTHAGINFSMGISSGNIWVSSTNNIISMTLIIAFVTLYSTTGGLRSVIETDVVQFVIAMVATLLYAIFVVQKTGGLGNMIHQLVALYGEAKTKQFLSFMPTGGEAVFPFLVIISLQWLFQMNSDGTGYIAQRLMATTSETEARRAGLVFSIFQILVRSLFWLPIIIGALILYPFNPATPINTAFTAHREMTFVMGIKDILPPLVQGLMLLGMLAALSSTISTLLSWGASYWSNDIYKRIINEAWLKRKPKHAEQVVVARITNFLVLLFALVIMGQMGSIQAAWYLSLLFGAGVGSVLILRWLWERINIYSEIAAIASSFVIAPIILYTVDAEWLKLLIMSASSTIIVIVVTYLTPPTEQKILAAFYQRVSPSGYWRKTAKYIGENPENSIKELWSNIVVVTLSSITIFLLLVGISKLLFPQPGQSIYYPILLIVIALGALPFWWKKAWGKTVVNEKVVTPK